MTTEFPPWVHALGGSLGSAIALCLLYPLERGMSYVYEMLLCAICWEDGSVYG